ncbi:MAG: outer membrane beta-barrel protein [Hyphomicrobiaceae bacterium]|nr:outer membrane beta-barrel protein [Hyphomicrobiaceae bacterium]
MLAGAFKRAAAAIVALGLAAGSAGAQSFDGTGVVKFGVFGQGNWLDVDISKPALFSVSPSGFGGGVSAGYDLVSKGRWLLGGEIDGSFGDAREKAFGIDYGFDYMLSLRARFGVFPRPDWLIYGTAGVGWLGTETQVGPGLKNMETVFGFVGGAGTEIDWHHVILFGEYLYGAFEDRSFTLAGVRHNYDPDAHIVRIGVKFKVGHDYEHEIDKGYYRRGDSLK